MHIDSINMKDKCESNLSLIATMVSWVNPTSTPVIHLAWNYRTLSKLMQQQPQHPILLSKQPFHLSNLAVYLSPQILDNLLRLVQRATFSHLIEHQSLHLGGNLPALRSYGEKIPQHTFPVVLTGQSLEHRVRKLPLVEILAASFLAGVFVRGKIDEVVSDLVEPADQDD